MECPNCYEEVPNSDFWQQIYEMFDRHVAKRVEESVDKNLPLIDEKIRSRIASYSPDSHKPELNKYMGDKIKSLVAHEVDQYLRIGYNDIKKAACEVVDKKLEATIESAVKFRLEAVKKKIVADLNT